jgi:hypothetical protein
LIEKKKNEQGNQDIFERRKTRKIYYQRPILKEWQWLVLQTERKNKRQTGSWGSRKKGKP